MLKLTLEQQSEFIERSPHAFESCKGAWGRGGATAVHLRSVTPAVLKAALDAAFHNIASGTVKQPRRAKGKRK